MTDFYRILFDRSSDAHLIFDKAGIFDCNQAAVDLLGCSSKDEVLHIHPATLSPEYQPNGLSSPMASKEVETMTLKHGWHRFEWLHRRVNGELFTVLVSLNAIEIDGRKMFLGIWHDLTESKRKEEQLTLLNAELRRANLRMREDLEAAAEVQRALLPRADFSIPHLKAAWAYLPSEILGGDQLNIFHLNDSAVGSTAWMSPATES
ncbi:MAG: PAS domain S-box protein, partial [Candidatus Methylacidiphilales bacterium]